MKKLVGTLVIAGVSVAVGACANGGDLETSSGAGGAGEGAGSVGSKSTGATSTSSQGGTSKGSTSSQGGTTSDGGTSSQGSTTSGSDPGTGGSGQGGPLPPDAYFPAASWFYQDISAAPVASNSSTVTHWLQNNGGWGTGQMRIDFSIEVLKADASTPFRTFDTTSEFYSPDCDDVPVPVPVGGALEGESGYSCENDGDCHLIVRSESDHRLYEMWRADISGSSFSGGCLAAWDMTRVYGPEGRGEQCTSADAAGFPIAPLLFTADEVAAGEIRHAIRFILPNARMRAGHYIRPATHAGAPSGPAQAPVYGSRWRLRADYPVDSLPSEGAKVVARAMQRYGMALADGGNIALTAQSDRSTAAQWGDLLGTHDLSALQPTDFEVLDTGSPIQQTNDCERTSY